MPSRFTARFLYVGEENRVFMVGLADDEGEAHGYTTFQLDLN